jgi:hypothetical protein
MISFFFKIFKFIWNFYSVLLNVRHCSCVAHTAIQLGARCVELSTPVIQPQVLATLHERMFEACTSPGETINVPIG